MPSILSDDDKQTVKRTVPKASNKIHAVAVAKLYIAHPNRQRWTYTGLQGAAVLANDLVGNTFWVKMVDVSPTNRGVIWDQEIYDTFSYNQDRTFFHTFELEECLAGLSFADEKEAKQFKKKMDEREKNAHKNTKNKPFGVGAAPGGGNNNTAPASGTGKSHRFGIGSLLPGHRHSSASHNQPAQSIIPPRDVTINSPIPTRPKANPTSTIDLDDPAVQAVLKDLLAMGITEDQIEEHAGFIRTYLEQNKATEAAENERRAKAPPPPPPGAAPLRMANLSPQSTGGSGSGRRGPPPAPPAPRRAGNSTPSVTAPPTTHPPSPSPSPPRAPSPPPGPRFRAPPPIADAGKYAHTNAPGRARAISQSQPSPSAPPAPPRVPAKTPAEDDSSQRFGVPPPFTGNRAPSGSVPPPPPARGAVPPPPPARDLSTPHAVPPPPPLPPKSPTGPPAPPPLPPSSSRPVPPPPGSGGPPPPPPLPPTSGGGPPLPPPPPPLPPASGGGGPPPPPLPPGRDGPPPPPLPQLPAGDSRGGLLADIRGGAKLKKVSAAEKKDRSAAMVPGKESASPATGGGGDAGGGLAGALASALAVRKSKVSHSDDEDDKDDWD